MKIVTHHHHTSVLRRVTQVTLCLLVLTVSSFLLTPASDAADTQPLTGSAYRLYHAANATSPGAGLAHTSAPATLSAPGQGFRLRMGVSEEAAPVQWKAVSSTYLHTCAIGDDDQVYCWGKNSDGQLGDGTRIDKPTPTPVNTSGSLHNKTVLQVATAGDHTCALASDYWVRCWGRGGEGRLGIGSVSSVTVPTSIQRGEIPAGEKIVKIAAGYHYTCAIATNHQAYCWGSNQYGQLGSGSTANQSLTPVAVKQTGALTGKTMRELASGGGYHMCGIASDNNAYCWGYGGDGQLGNGTNTFVQREPIAVSRGATPQVGSATHARAWQIAAGYYHTCIIGADARPYCWGKGEHGRLGHGSQNNASVPVAVSLPGGVAAHDLALGMHHSCLAGSNGRAYCWGYGTSGQIGDSGLVSRWSPALVAQTNGLAGKKAQAVAAGSGHSCVLTKDRTLHCWGHGAELGSGTTGNSTTPVSVATVRSRNILPYKSAQSIAQGQGGVTCGVFSDQWVYCWGNNATGQVGSGSAPTQTTPIAIARGAIPTGVTLRQVAVGGQHACAVGSNEQVYCWGNNQHGQLGDGTTTNRTLPVAVLRGALPSERGIMAVAAGSGHTCVIDMTYRAYCWGLNNGGQLGNNSQVSHSTSPVAVAQGALPSNQLLRKFAAGNGHTCAIASDDRAYCWGSNNRYGLGNGSAYHSHVPSALVQGQQPSDRMVRDIGAGYGYGCVVGANNKVYCWGWNNDGQLGNNSSSAYGTSPVAVSSGAMPQGGIVHELSVGSLHSCAIGTNLRTYCWGDSSEGALGNSTTLDARVPVGVDTSGVMNGQLIHRLAASHEHTCAVASDGAIYCWGKGDKGQRGNNATNSGWQPVATSRLTNAAAMNAEQFKLQYAKKTVTTCAAQATGFADVTATTPIAYQTLTGVAHGAAMTAASAGEPSLDLPFVRQSVRTQQGMFKTNNTVVPGQIALWDFSLKDNGAVRGASYCMRIVTGGGATLSAYTAVPELEIPGSLSVDIVNSAGSSVSAPSVAMNAMTLQTNRPTYQQKHGQLSTPSQRIRVSNSLSSTGWSLSIAPTYPNQQWQRQGGNGSYRYNGSYVTGQLRVNPGTASIQPSSGCSATGVTKGTSKAYSASVTSITLMEADATAGMDCSWDLQYVDLMQFVPGKQRPGQYTLDVTVTVVAK